MISNRHIRHDWKTWLDRQDQRSVRTLCGATSYPRLSGIPGITEQLPVVEHNSRVIWGWCMRCVIEMYKQFCQLPDVLPTTGEIAKLYRKALRVIEPQVRKVIGEDIELKSFSRLPRRQNVYLGFEDAACYLCGCTGSLDRVDHIIAVSRGGVNAAWNMARVHRACNDKKGNRSLEETRKIFPEMRLPQRFLDVTRTMPS